MKKLMKCARCGTYTLEDSCKSCNEKTFPVSYKFKPYGRKVEASGELK